MICQEDQLIPIKDVDSGLFWIFDNIKDAKNILTDVLQEEWKLSGLRELRILPLSLSFAFNKERSLKGYVYMNEEEELGGKEEDGSVYFFRKKRTDYRGGFKQIPAIISFSSPDISENNTGKDV